MSMVGNYLRLTLRELADLRANPGSVLDFLYPDGDDEHPEGRHLDIDKSWHAIHFLLNGEAWEGEPPLIHVVLGGTPISDEDHGYGPARHLSPEEVRAVAVALDDIPAFELLERFDSQALNGEEIYPGGWSDTQEEREYISDYYLRLVAFFKRAAEAGDGMLLCLN